MATRLARSDELDAIAQLIVAENAHPERHCIQSETGPDVTTTAGEMRRRLDADELVVVIARDEPDPRHAHGPDPTTGPELDSGGILGAFACEVYPPSGRGWLRGPFVRPGVDPEPIFHELLCRLLRGLPDPVRRVDAFLNVANERAAAFYRAMGFQPVRHVHVYWAKAEDVDLGAARDGVEPPPELWASAAALHDEIFPDTYVSGEGVLAQRDEDHRLFVRTDERGVVGSVYVEADHDASEAFVSFLGVRADARGRGVGEDLLRSALRWGLVTKGFPAVALSVHDELANARSLYERVGFRLRYTGLHLRRDL